MCSRRLAEIAGAAAVVVLVATAGLAQPIPESTPVPMWGPNGEVRALARVGDTLLVGGEFTVVGPATGGLAIADAGDASAVTTTTDVGTVNLLASDGTGGWYAAQWREVSQGPTVLRVTAAGGLHPAWSPPSFDGDNLYDLVVDGGRVFVAGQFLTVNGVARPYLVALDGSTGAVTPWTPTLRSGLPLGALPRLATANGRLYLSLVDFISGQFRADVVAVDTTSGALLPFQIPSLPDGNPYDRLAFTGDRLVASGVGCGGPSSNGVCAFDGTGQPVWSWGPPTAGQWLWALWADHDRVYVGLRDPNLVVALDAATGAVLPWSIPGPTLVGDLVDDGTAVYASTIPTVGAEGRLSAFDRTSAATLDWRPVVGTSPMTIAAGGGRVAFGGQFRTAGGIERRNLIAIDLTTGRATDRAPDASGPIYALAAVGDIVVAAKGSAAPEVFAFSATTGQRLPWGLVPNGHPLSLAVAGGALYIGGLFSELSGQSRGSLAAVSLATATLLPWDPRPGFEVSELVASGTTLYAAGTDYGGLMKTARAAAFRLGSNDRLAFNPPLNWVSDVKQLATSGGRVIATARYWGPPRSFGISWLHPEHGHVQGDLPLPFPTSIAAGGAETFIVGGTTDIDSTGRLAAFETQTGRLLPWAPEASHGRFRVVFTQPDFVAVGGSFDRMAGKAVSNLALFRTARPAPPRRLAASTVASTIALGWQVGPPPTATSFIVEAGTAPGATDIGRFGVGAATAASGSLGPGTYYVRVRGVSAAGEGAASSEVIVTLPATATQPSAPGALSASVTNGVVTLAWGAASGNATGYVLEVGTASGLTNIGSLPTGHLDTALATPAPAGVYFVRVRAVNAFGSSAATNEAQVVVP